MKKIYILALLILFPFVYGRAQSLKTGRSVSIPTMEKSSRNLTLSADLVKKKSIEKPNTLKVPQLEIEKSDCIQRIQGGLKMNTRTTNNSLDSVVFMRPQGYFLPGLSVDYSYYTYYILFGPAFSASKWRNLSGGASSYSWTLPDPEGEVDMNVGGATNEIFSTDTFPQAYYPFSAYFSNPTLTGTDGVNSLTYSWGREDSTYIYTGGILNNILGTGACNYDNHKNLYAYYFPDGGYMFGGVSDDENTVDAVGNYFEKPTHTYVLDSLWINATYCTAPAGTKFNVIIHKVDEETGILTDTIATATTTIEEVLGPFGNGNVYYTLVFGQFNVYDEDLRFDVTQDYLEINDAIFVELNGFNNVDNIDFSVMAQEFNVSPVNENNAYIFYYDNGERYFGNYTAAGSTSLSFNLGIIYSYLFADDSTFNVSENGGSKVFNVETFYNPEMLWTEEDLPDWLDLSYNFDEENWDMEVQLTAGPLPESLNKRYEEVTMATYGAKYTFYIIQERGGSTVDVTDTSNPESDIRLTNFEGIITTTYPKDFNSLIMYNLNGSVIASYELPSTGTFSFIPKGSINKGVYIFRFFGNNFQSKTVRMIY